MNEQLTTIAREATAVQREYCKHPTDFILVAERCLAWYMNIVKDKIWNLGYYDEKWMIYLKPINGSADGTRFYHKDPTILWLIISEFVLSNGKNDLREFVAELE